MTDYTPLDPYLVDQARASMSAAPAPMSSIYDLAPQAQSALATPAGPTIDPAATIGSFAVPNIVEPPAPPMPPAMIPWRDAPGPAPRPAPLAPEQPMQLAGPAGTLPTDHGPPTAPPPPAAPRNPLAELLAHASKPVASAATSGAPGGMSRLVKARDDARAAYLGTFDAQAAAKGAEASAESQKQDAISHAAEAASLRQEADAQIAKHEAETADKQFQAFNAKTQSMIDDLAASKVDPSHLFHSGDSLKDFSYALGALLAIGGGAAMGDARGGIAMVNQWVERDMRAQEHAIEQKKAAIGARNTLYGQLRQEFGDRKLAREAYGAAMMTAAETRLKGMLAGYESKSVQARGNEVLAQIDQQKQEHLANFSQQALTVAQQQAAASAAAQRAAADKAFEKSMKVAELSLKEREVGAREAEAGKKSSDKTSDQTAEYARELEKSGIPQASAEIDALKAHLPKPGQPIPGLGLTDDAIAKYGGELGKRALMSSDERINRANVEKLALAYRKAVTGSGGSAEELASINSAFLGARSTEELWNAIATADDILAARKANLQAGYGPKVTSTYDENLKSSVRPPLSTMQPGVTGAPKR